MLSPVEARVSSLLARWVRLREEGEIVSAEDLCSDCPDLLEDVRHRIETLNSSFLAQDSSLRTPHESGFAPEQGSFPFGAELIGGYKVLGELGRGGMGVVYRAFDRNREQIVALKAMQHISASSLYRFKHEFRALADVSHPNLVGLYELLSDGNVWFFTMELVEGPNFLEHVRSIPASSATEATTKVLGTATELGLIEPDASTIIVPGDECGRIARLRETVRQLAEGLHALHESGLLHRDIKPSNVLVTRSGRVVLVDFGLAAELDLNSLHQSTDQMIVGTVAYMAPEQAAGKPVSPSSDWYSVGIMIFEALAGKLPFTGSVLDVLVAKMKRSPPPLRELAPGVPEDLESLCNDLLRLEPHERPTGQDVLRRLGGSALGRDRAQVLGPSHRSSAELVGRDGHLAALRAAYQAVRSGKTVVLLVNGRSGAGKTELIREFLTQLASQGEAAILAGRCYEQEAVPYKGFDTLIDSLSRYLKRLSDHQIEAVLPRDWPALVRVFPVLDQVSSSAASSRREFGIPDQTELRRRAFLALRELLARLGDRLPVVLFIDDLQWSDLDSASLFAALLQGPDPPMLLFLGSYRSEDAEISPALRAVLAAEEQAGAPIDWRQLTVEALTPAEARQLAFSLLDANTPNSRAVAEIISRDSGGNPFFIQELARFANASPSIFSVASQDNRVSLERVLWDRICALPQDARRLLEAVAVSGRPLPPLQARLAAHLVGDERATLALLRTGRLIRSTGLAEQMELETYHDRIRETIIARLSQPELQDHHRSLAHVIEASGTADAELLATHFHGALEHEKACHYYALAGDHAAQTLAFDRAARFYRLALELGPDAALKPQAVLVRLGDALANAGRGAEAARSYLKAADQADMDDALDLQRRAAMQFLISGHVEDGETVLRTVLSAAHIWLPQTPRAAIGRLVWQRARLWLRGIGFERAETSTISEQSIRKIDVCWSAAVGLSMFDPVRGALFQAMGLREALRCGEPYRVSRALALEACHLAVGGQKTRPRAERLLEKAEELASCVDDPHAMGMVHLMRGGMSYLTGHPREALTLCERAAVIFRDCCTGAFWELDSANSWTLYSLHLMGEIAEVNQRLHVFLKEASDRGDLYALFCMGTVNLPFCKIADDDIEGAWDSLDELHERCAQRGCLFQEMDERFARVFTQIYSGQASEALEATRELSRFLKRSMLSRIQLFRILLLDFQSRAALACAARARRPEPALLKLAERNAAGLDREESAFASALAPGIRAISAHLRGDSNAAIGLLRQSATALEAIDRGLYAAAARWILGKLLAGDEGRTLVSASEDWMTQRGIKSPTRMGAMMTGLTLD